MFPQFHLRDWPWALPQPVTPLVSYLPRSHCLSLLVNSHRLCAGAEQRSWRDFKKKEREKGEGPRVCSGRKLHRAAASLFSFLAIVSLPLSVGGPEPAQRIWQSARKRSWMKMLRGHCRGRQVCLREPLGQTCLWEERTDLAQRSSQKSDLQSWGFGHHPGVWLTLITLVMTV